MSFPITHGRADLHMHTTASDGVATVREVLDHVAARRHLNVIAITDHDRVDAALWAVEHQHEYDFDIIPGIEVSTTIGHVLGLWVYRPIKPGLSLDETVAAIHEQGGVAILAHPYHVHMGIVMRSAWRYTRRPEVLLESKLDAIEAHNAGIVLPAANLAARALARRIGLPVTGNSDAHTLGAIGSGRTVFPGTSATDLRRAILAGKTQIEGSAWPLQDYWNFSKNSTHNTSSEFLAERSSSVPLTRR